MYNVQYHINASPDNISDALDSVVAGWGVDILIDEELFEHHLVLKMFDVKMIEIVSVSPSLGLGLLILSSQAKNVSAENEAGQEIQLMDGSSTLAM